MLLPAPLMNIDSAFSAVVDTNPGFFDTDRTFHD